MFRSCVTINDYPLPSPVSPSLPPTHHCTPYHTNQALLRSPPSEVNQMECEAHDTSIQWWVLNMWTVICRHPTHLPGMLHRHISNYTLTQTTVLETSWLLSPWGCLSLFSITDLGSKFLPSSCMSQHQRSEDRFTGRKAFRLHHRNYFCSLFSVPTFTESCQ